MPRGTPGDERSHEYPEDFRHNGDTRWGWRELLKPRDDHHDTNTIDTTPGRRTRRRARARAGHRDRARRDRWRRTPSADDLPVGVVLALALVMAVAGLWFAFGGHDSDRPRDRPAATTPSVPDDLTGTDTAPSGPTTGAGGETAARSPGRGVPPQVEPSAGERPTAGGLDPQPPTVLDRRDPASIAAHVAVDACSYAWTETLDTSIARVTRWMTPAAAARWRPTAADREMWATQVSATREAVTCRVLGTAGDGPAADARRGITVTLSTSRRLAGDTPATGVTSFAVLTDRRADGTWVVSALTVTG